MLGQKAMSVISLMCCNLALCQHLLHFRPQKQTVVSSPDSLPLAGWTSKNVQQSLKQEVTEREVVVKG